MSAPALTRSASDMDFKKSGIDWSETYLENDQLDSQLESRIHQIHKAKYKATIDSDYSLKEARRQAEEIQQLSNAIKKKDRPNSVKLYESSNKSGSFSKSRGTSAVMRETISEKEEMDANKNEMSDSKNENFDSKQSRVSNEEEERSTDANNSNEGSEDEIKLRPINVAMFKLSLRRFNSNKQNNSPSNELHRQSMSISNIRQTQSAAPSNIRDRARNIRDLKRSGGRTRRPMTSKLRQLKDGEVLEAMDIHPVVVFGVNARKMKETKSRRELEEMSKIQHEEKFGKPDKEKEERKLKMAAWAKGDGSLENKIRNFITDIEDFKRRSKGSDNILLSYRRTNSVL
ncbi:uncharacterized protein LOC134242392 [Saccostrea cucullata]|uniref:uncharacterized protein LOC134242392 n=1 Tax=Saccostrea cuccullata TaxID=36930 RepID=UPI002ED009C2